MSQATSLRLWASRTGLLLLAQLLAGCGVFRHVAVEPLASGSQRPANVGAFVSARDGDDPLPELTPGNFKVYENDQLVPSDQSQLTLLDISTVAATQAVLLVDMSTASSPEARARLAKGALNFVQKVTPRAPVAVFAFDGAENLAPIATLPRGSKDVTMAALESYTPRDTSRNLNGAIVNGLSKLTTLLSQSGKQIRIGLLVLYTAGPDVAGRVDRDKAHDLVWESDYDVLTIGAGEQTDAAAEFARHGMIQAQSVDTLPIAFEEAGVRALGELQKYYLVSYCSPARAGTRRLRLEVTYNTKDGEEHSGDFDMEFSAKSFGPGCNSAQAPRLTLTPKEPVAEPESSSHGSGEPPSKKAAPRDSRDQDKGEDAPVAPPEQGGYAK
ncbi:MAG TPA: hypothetical protein VHB79_16720 [Polyangiaceae bacterium]|nr:hypothetical protein [Polyangiaceae bacterium]